MATAAVTSTETALTVKAERGPRWLARRMGWDARRVIGVDLARGLAMIGMFAAHLNAPQSLAVADPSTYFALVHGRSAILFALLAGVSLAIVTGGPRPHTDRDAVVGFRVRTLVRAILLFALGGLLTMLETPVMVILEAYAGMFVLALLVMTWSAKRLWIAVGVLAVLGPLVTITARSAMNGLSIWPQGAWSIAFGTAYPVATWFVFTLAGIAIGRSDLRSMATTLRLLAGGVAAAAVGYGLGHLASSSSLATSLPDADPYAIESMPLGEMLSRLPGLVLAQLLTAEPHSGTPFEVLGSGGFVVAVLALCLLVARTPVRFALAPLAAVGALSLTVYSVHIVAIRYYRAEIWGDSSTLIYFAGFSVAALVGATLWRLTLGKGPLERAIAWAANRASRYTDRSGDRPSRTDEPGSSSTSS